MVDSVRLVARGLFLLLLDKRQRQLVVVPVEELTCGRMLPNLC
jgi:hypothetical protein